MFVEATIQDTVLAPSGAKCSASREHITRDGVRVPERVTSYSHIVPTGLGSSMQLFKEL